MLGPYGLNSVLIKVKILQILQNNTPIDFNTRIVMVVESDLYLFMLQSYTYFDLIGKNQLIGNISVTLCHIITYLILGD